MQISELTRRELFDTIRIEGVHWPGRLEEVQFLSRIYPLQAMPSTDSRFKDAAGDIWQHRVNNNDWEDDWVFSDSRFNLQRGDDEVLLRFLCEMLHPVVRSDRSEVERLRQAFNQTLAPDGFEIVETANISGRPIFSARRRGVSANPGLRNAKKALIDADASYVAQQISRMEAAVEADPSLTIGTAKELIETCCKTILGERNVRIDEKADLPRLVKETCKVLRLTPEDVSDKVAAATSIRKVLGSLASITQGMAELRNRYGTGHGKESKTKGLGSRHAKLAVGAAATLAAFLIETHEARS